MVPDLCIDYLNILNFWGKMFWNWKMDIFGFDHYNQSQSMTVQKQHVTV